MTSWPKDVEETEPPAEVAVPVSVTVDQGTEELSTADMDEESEGPARQAFCKQLGTNTGRLDSQQTSGAKG